MTKFPLEQVDNLIRQTAIELLVPRWGQLKADEIELKAPDEWVTALDRMIEERLTFELRQLIPGSTVIGEEQCAKTPGLLDNLDEGVVWLVDPVDGTRNLVAGIGPISIMVALLKKGETLASWMFNPLTGVMCHAIKGGGAWINAQRIAIDVHAASKGQGIVRTRFLPDSARAQLVLTAANLLLQPGSNCAGDDYPSVVLADNEFALYWRILPWDHAPGVLFVIEAGGVAAHLDGASYRPSRLTAGLIVARNQTIWNSTRKLLPANFSPS